MQGSCCTSHTSHVSYLTPMPCTCACFASVPQYMAWYDLYVYCDSAPDNNSNQGPFSGDVYALISDSGSKDDASTVLRCRAVCQHLATFPPSLLHTQTL